MVFNLDPDPSHHRSLTAAAAFERRVRSKPTPKGDQQKKAVSSQSATLVHELRSELGESEFSAILAATRKAMGSAFRMRTSHDNDTIGMLAANAARCEAIRAAILMDALTVGEAAAFASKTSSIIITLARAGELLAIRDGRRLRFPRWQFDARSTDGLVAGLRLVLSAMDASPFRKAAWLISPNQRFKRRAPIELLRDGETDSVFMEAKAVASS